MLVVFGRAPKKTTVDDINPASPMIRDIPYNSHSLGSLR